MIVPNNTRIPIKLNNIFDYILNVNITDIDYSSRDFINHLVETLRSTMSDHKLKRNIISYYNIKSLSELSEEQYSNAICVIKELFGEQFLK